MRFLLLLACVWILGLSEAQAGAWPRPKGEGFAAVTTSYRYAPDTRTYDSEGGVYLEYGVANRITIGFDAMDTLDEYRHAYAFVRWAASRPDTRWKLAFTLGAGGSKTDDGWGPMTRVAVSTGRDMRLFTSGWWNLTAAVEDHNGWSGGLYKLDATVGWNLSDRFKTFLDVETSKRKGSVRSLTARGSVAWRLTGPTHFLFGVEAKDSNERLYGWRAGFWVTF